MNEDKIIEKLLDHDDKFNQLNEKIDSNSRDINKKLEHIVTIVERLDQERIFTTRWVKRIESEVDENKQEITKLKQALNIA